MFLVIYALKSRHTHTHTHTHACARARVCVPTDNFEYLITVILFIL